MPALANLKWEKFCLAVYAGSTLEKAYIAAGFDPNTKQAKKKAIALKARAKIQARLKELADGAAVKAEDRRTKLINAMEAIAFDAENGAHTRLRALEVLMRVERMFEPDRGTTVIVNNTVALVDAPPPETYEQWVARRARALGAPAGAAARRDPGEDDT